MGTCHPATIHQTEDQSDLSFCSGIQLGRSIEEEKVVCLPLVLEEVVVAEDRPIRAEMRMKVPTTLHQLHRKSPDLTSLVETL